MQQHLVAMGISSCLGQGLWEHHQKIAARDHRFRRQRTFLGSDFKPQLTAFPGDIGEQSALSRMMELGAEAIADLMAFPMLPLPGPRLHIAIVLPVPCPQQGLRPSVLQELGDRLSEMILGHLAGYLAALRLYAKGAVGFAWALRDFAAAAVPEDALIILSADSYRCRVRMNALLAQGRLFSRKHRYGQIPGEAAVAALFTPRAPEKAIARITGAAIEVETLREGETGATDFSAMSKACLSALPADQLSSCWLTDWNNSRYGATELSYAQLRLAGRFERDFETLHLPLVFGSTGAAGLGVALAASLSRPGCSLLTGSVELSAERAALASVSCGSGKPHPR